MADAMGRQIETRHLMWLTRRYLDGDMTAAEYRAAVEEGADLLDVEHEVTAELRGTWN